MDYKRLEFQAMKALANGCLIRDHRIAVCTGEGSWVDLTNFVPVVTGCVRIVNVFDGKERVVVKIAALFVRDSEVVGTSETEVTVEELDSFNFQADLDRRCFVENVKGANASISTCLRKQLAGVDEHIVWEADRLGHFCVEGKHGFCTGDSIIGEDLPEIRIAKRLAGYALLSDKLSRVVAGNDVAEYVKRLIHFNRRITPILFVANILGILHDFFAKAGAPIKFSLYLLGEQSTGKTTLATTYCSMYDRADDLQQHLHNLTASEARLDQILDVERDMPVIIDDLRKSDSKRNLRQQEMRLDNLIRCCGNGLGRETLRSQYDVNGFAIFIGEYALSNPSTNNRVVMLEFFKEDLDLKRLNAISAAPAYLSIFFRDFIEWALRNYGGIVNTIKTSAKEYLIERSKREAYQERLYSHANVLFIAWRIFLMYCHEKNWDVAFSEEDFAHCVNNVIADQIECMELDAPEPVSNIVPLFKVIEDELFDDRNSKRPRKDRWNQRLYFDESDGLLYIPGPSLQSFMESAGLECLRFDVVNEFYSHGMLQIDKNIGGSRTKKFQGKRCYVVDYVAYREYVKEFYEQGQ